MACFAAFLRGLRGFSNLHCYVNYLYYSVCYSWHQVVAFLHGLASFFFFFTSTILPLHYFIIYLHYYVTYGQRVVAFLAGLVLFSYLHNSASVYGDKSGLRRHARRLRQTQHVLFLAHHLAEQYHSLEKKVKVKVLVCFHNDSWKKVKVKVSCLQSASWTLSYPAKKIKVKVLKKKLTVSSLKSASMRMPCPITKGKGVGLSGLHCYNTFCSTCSFMHSSIICSIYSFIHSNISAVLTSLCGMM